MPPVITLSGKPLEPSLAPQEGDVTRVLQYMVSVAKENEDYNRFLSTLIENMYARYQQESHPQKKAQALHQVREFYCAIGNLDKKYIPNITPEIIEIFIQGAKDDAKRACDLKTLSQHLLDSPTIELPLLATFYFTLSNELERMKGIEAQTEPEKTLIEKLTLALEKLILPKDSPLQKLYHLCPAVFNYTPNTNVAGEALLRGEYGTFTLSEKFVMKRYLKGMFKLCEVWDDILPDEVTALNEAWKIDTHHRLYTNLMPGCYALSPDNYRAYPFQTLYLMADIYRRVATRKEDLKKEKLAEQHAELHTELDEIEAMIEQGRILSLEKRAITHTATQEFTSDLSQTTAEATVASSHEKLAALSKKHLETLEALFTNKQTVSNIQFSEFSDVVKALGGQVKTFAGSKTRIYLPGEVSNLPTLVGGLHKPHAKNRPPLHFIQCRLICKALNRARITKEAVKGALAARGAKKVMSSAPLPIINKASDQNPTSKKASVPS